jgi:hypothetical protein
LLDPIHGYSVSGTYRYLTTIDDHWADGLLNDVWHKLEPSKVSLFGWRLLQDRIPTRANLVRRHVLQPNDNLCVGGCVTAQFSLDLFLIVFICVVYARM